MAVVFQLAPVADRLLRAIEVPAGQAMGIELDGDLFPAETKLFKDHLQVGGRVCILGIPPDADILDNARLFCLNQIRTTGQKHRLAAVRRHDEALVVDEAAGVVAGQPVHAFLREHEHGIDAARCKLSPQPVLSLQMLRLRKGEVRLRHGTHRFVLSTRSSKLDVASRYGLVYHSSTSGIQKLRRTETAWKKGSLRIDSLWAQQLVTTAMTCGTRQSFEAVSLREGLDIYAD
ncbi:hypothetical protein D3C73_749650 [compost metagenome]